MEEIINLIKARIQECKSKGDTFILPSINMPGVSVEETDGQTSGSVLLETFYKITLPNGDAINIEYQSKDKCRTFQINPDRSYISVTCPDSRFDFADAWDERY